MMISATSKNRLLSFCVIGEGYQHGLTTYALIIERHIRLRYDQSTHTLLSMSRGKLVAQFRSPGLTKKHFQKLRLVFRVRDEDLVDVSSQRILVGHRSVLPLDAAALLHVTGASGCLLVDVDPARL